MDTPPSAGASPTGSLGPSSSGEGSEVKLDHWVYGVTPGKGYDIKSVSRGLNLSFYDERLQGFYTPIRGESLQEGKVSLVMVHPAPSLQEVLFSVVGRGPDDEMGRPTFANHTVIAPLASLKNGTLTMERLEQAIRDFDTKQPNAVGDIDALSVPLSSSVGLGSLTQGLRRCLTLAAAETLVTRLLTNPTGRTLLLMRNSTSEQRIRALRLLLAALNLSCGLPWFVSMSDAPTASALDHFQFVISPRGVRADNTWTLLDSGLDRPALPRPGGQALLYSTLERCFSVD
ncbi:MAG: hypothetical protein KGJ23_06610 [Euryarchaeota archaeon]|nr:hypothetical protein [Euryarchaeota archaeon]MDE1836271.1 hypothetical protein [Euryarchaeota archaeon]MDE1880899.1 hypothetical protein [Euryarchaeota archaeon]MDE2044333.1 hypothetical protein [Thermoplasmata archaeon]